MIPATAPPSLAATLRGFERHLLELRKGQLDTMDILDQLKAQLAEQATQIALLQASATNAKEDAATQADLTNQAIGLMQALNAKIAELAAGAGGATQAQLQELLTTATANSQQLTTALASADEANTARDAAAAQLAAGIKAETPATPATP